jgi:hypothetical protein
MQQISGEKKKRKRKEQGKESKRTRNAAPAKRAGKDQEHEDSRSIKVGMRVQIFWDGEEQWFDATVQKRPDRW